MKSVYVGGTIIRAATRTQDTEAGCLCNVLCWLETGCRSCPWLLNPHYLMPFTKIINILVLSPLQRIDYSQQSVGCPQATRSVIISRLPTVGSPLRSIVSIGVAEPFCHQGGARFASEVTSKKYQQCLSPEQNTSLKMYCKFNGICTSAVYCSLPTFCDMFVHWCPFSWLVRYGMKINRRPMCLLFLVPCKSNSEWNKWLWTYWRSLCFGRILFTRNKYWILYFLFRFYGKCLA